MFGVLKDWGTLLWGIKNISFLQYWGQLYVCCVGVSIWGQGQQCQIFSQYVHQPYYIKITPLEFGAAMPCAFWGAPGTGGLACQAARHWREELHSLTGVWGKKSWARCCDLLLPVPPRPGWLRVNSCL
jgi:hypothetical protein